MSTTVHEKRASYFHIQKTFHIRFPGRDIPKLKFYLRGKYAKMRLILWNRDQPKELLLPIDSAKQSSKCHQQTYTIKLWNNI